MSHSFVDYARVFVKAGDGGNGCVAFRREKYVPRGGPNGGDGGDGGSVWFVVDPSMATLLDLKMRSSIQADRGSHGQGWRKTGKTGEDIEIAVPMGVVISDEAGNTLADLIAPGERFLAARGGKGGLGNQHFATSVNQAPRKAFPGTPGEERSLVLELKLIAQVGLVGLPNAGKSTLLAALTSATPKIAPYPFTTLHPNLGVMEVDEGRRATLADIPGLIEGAVHGAGLGARFLRHIERTSLLVHLVAPPDDRDDFDPAVDPDRAAEHLMEAHELVRRELEGYSSTLAQKGEIVVFSKLDLLAEEARQPLMEALKRLGVEACAISAASGEGLDAFKAALIEKMDGLGLIEGVPPEGNLPSSIDESEQIDEHAAAPIIERDRSN